jgi:hypothetical protein
MTETGVSLILNRQDAIIEPSKMIGGKIMARDYGKEYKREKEQGKLVKAKVSPEVFDDFTAKTEMNGTNKNAVLKACIEAYTYGDLYIDSNGNPKTK